MNCPRCNSEKTIKNGKEYSTGKQVHLCKDCKRSFTDNVTPAETNRKPKVGMSLTEFREKHDVDYIVQKILSGLDPEIIYEKNDICKLTGLRPGYPGLSATIDNHKDYYGKVGSTMYFSHPSTIAKLKNDAKLN